jgi:hypothetical protein
MNLTLPLEKMSIGEKISAMESIWEDLIQNAGSLSSPDWHKKILESRSQSVSQGTSGLSDWDTAKNDILKSVR